MLRLSTKYLIEDAIRTKALAHLRMAWPTTLKAWDLREDLARLHELETGQPRGHRFAHPIVSTRPCPSSAHTTARTHARSRRGGARPQAVINLAREIGADEVLPSAFYELSRYTFAQIFEPAPGEPLEAPPPPASASAPSSPSSPPSPVSACTLSPEDMRRLALGKEAAAQAVTALIVSMEHNGLDHPTHRRARSSGGARFVVRAGGGGVAGAGTGSAGAGTAAGAGAGVCVTPAACRRDLEELVALATQHYVCDRERGCADPLYVAEELGQLKSAELADCAACARALEAWAARERERLWRTIPDWFRLRRGAGA